LIETPFAFARGVQRHGNNQIEAPARQARIVECFINPTTEQATQVKPTVVLKIMDNFSHDTAAAVERHSQVEMQGAPFAIRTGKSVANRAGERLRTLGAKWRRDPRYGVKAGAAKRFMRSDRRPTCFAARRIKQTNETAKRIAERESGHNSPSRERTPSWRARE